jgi:hypothetical protein
MTSTRRGKQSNGERPTAREGYGRPTGDELIKLRAQLAAEGAPEETLRALDVACEADQALRNLVEAGVLPSPEESLAWLMEGWQPLLAPHVDTLSAELSGAEFLGLMRQIVQDPDELLPGILTALIRHAESTAKPEALAMLRLLAVLGPSEIQPAAREAADRLVAVGLTDCPWVGELGTAQAGPCFGFVDESGIQEGIAVTFSYGRKPHALVVLIDHGLGGGVKDCYPTDRPAQVRAEYQGLTKRHGWDFCDYTPAAARAILERALAARPCPVAPEEVQDVGAYLDLLRRRVVLLPDGGVPTH